MAKFGSKTAGAVSEEVLEIASQVSGRSGRFSTFIAAIALLFSAFSFYETVLRRPDIRVFVPPIIKFSHPGRGGFEVFNIPLTLSNFGARPGTVLSMELTVKNPKANTVKRFYSAGIGDWNKSQKGGIASFKPISVAGKSSYPTDLLFYTRQGESVDRILDLEGGTYQFEMTLNLVSSDTIWPLDKLWPSTVAPIRFEMQIGKLDYRNFSGGGTMDLWAKDYRSTIGGQ